MDLANWKAVQCESVKVSLQVVGCLFVRVVVEQKAKASLTSTYLVDMHAQRNDLFVHEHAERLGVALELGHFLSRPHIAGVGNWILLAILCAPRLVRKRIEVEGALREVGLVSELLLPVRPTGIEHGSLVLQLEKGGRREMGEGVSLREQPVSCLQEAGDSPDGDHAQSAGTKRLPNLLVQVRLLIDHLFVVQNHKVRGGLRAPGHVLKVLYVLYVCALKDCSGAVRGDRRR